MTTNEPEQEKPDRVKVCGECHGLRPWGSLSPCSGCGGSGIEGLTAREAYLMEFPSAKS